MSLMEKREWVQPVRVEKKCDCTVDGVSLVSNGVMAGRPTRYLYSCPRCKSAHYLDEQAVTIQYITMGAGYEQG